ncbi:DUF5691 domain-containing protein [Mucilaginibacter sp.]|jgi:hypothetical protein|uniref:DUF5691 domain-containing protein n=1 Tax=Mucilaginibacter sp. TaxID=1882438 RepID=UPI002BE610E1|nr:DUF5691 domain-containing protein [Mucilaginibacter sp.]HTI60243.1 DUF5691 domain-containing protein [Mucilaginibacter sp.]
MKAWEYVINTAMLGTDKPMPGNQDLPDSITEIAIKIDAIDSIDREAKFLQKAAVIYNYRQCGFTPFQKQDLPVTMTEGEIKPYCSLAAASILNDILYEDNTALLELWMSRCDENEQLFLPDVLPAVLDKAAKYASLRLMVIACSGNRGEWLSKLNPVWDYFRIFPDEEIWQTGKPEERAALLKKIRQDDPGRAREWLRQTWEQETAASKVELLKTLRINVGTGDLEWLENLLDEKGQKVKDGAMALLKLIPGSSIVNQYEGLLKQSVTLKKEKALLGMLNKVSIQQTLPAVVDESIFKSGIEKLAGQKASITDESFILYQLIGSVPPTFWEKQFECTPGQVVAYFDKYASDKIPALGLAVSRFKQTDWIPYFLDQPGFYPDFLEMMTTSEQEKYLSRFLKVDALNTIHFALTLKHEWGLDFASTVLREMANHPYEYNRGFFSKNIKLIPAGILNELKKIGPKDANLQNTWEKNSHHLIKLLGLKQQMIKAFNT